MIFGKLNQDNNESQFLSSDIQQGLAYLQQTDFLKLGVGLYPIKEKEIIAVIQEYETLPKTEKLAEQHKAYVDIQYVVEGQEIIGVGSEHPNNEIIKEYDPSTDAVIYGRVENEKEVVMKTGDYLILFPSDIHRPGCNFELGSLVRKVVVKVAVN